LLLRQHALGPCAPLVEQAAEGNAGGDLQCPCRDGRKKPFFRDAFKRDRCPIPVSGYYEWQTTTGGKQPWFFTAADDSPLLTAAGLFDEWKDRATGEVLKSCTMIITEPNDFVAKVHDRHARLADRGSIGPWLSGEVGKEALKPAPNDCPKRWPVSKRVNSSKADAHDATLIDPIQVAVV
jgi:putative SOS response-associated peptidase YedK